VSSLRVEDLRPAPLHKQIAARKRRAHLAKLATAMQIIAQSPMSEKTTNRVRHRVRARKPHNRAARKEDKTVLDLSDELTFPSLPVRPPTEFILPTKANILVPLVPQLSAPDYAAAVMKDHADYLPFVMSQQSRQMADALISSPLPSGTCSPVISIARSFARTLVPRAARAPRAPKPISIRRILPSKLGAFRRPLGSMFSPIVSTPKVFATQPEPTREVGVFSALAPAWLMQGLAWNGNTASATIDLSCTVPLPKKKAAKTLVTKKEPTNKKHAKITKKRPLHTRNEKKRSNTSRTPAKAKTGGDRRQKRHPKASFAHPALPVFTRPLTTIPCLARTC